MENNKVYWEAFFNACKENKYELVDGFCSENDFDQYSHNFEAFHVAIKARALDVINTLLVYKIGDFDFSGHEYLLIWLLNLKFNKEKDAAFRDEIAFNLIKKGFGSALDSWSSHGYANWKKYGHLYAAFKNSPKAFFSLWSQCSESDKFETLFLFLTEWTDDQGLIPREPYLQLVSHWKQFLSLGHVEKWFTDPRYEGLTFATFFFKDQSEEEMLRDVKRFIDEDNLLMLRVLMRSQQWCQFPIRQNLFAIAKYAHENDRSLIRDFIIQKFKSVRLLSWSEVFESVCEMPNLSSLKDVDQVFASLVDLAEVPSSQDEEEETTSKRKREDQAEEKSVYGAKQWAFYVARRLDLHIQDMKTPSNEYLDLATKFLILCDQCGVITPINKKRQKNRKEANPKFDVAKDTWKKRRHSIKDAWTRQNNPSRPFYYEQDEKFYSQLHAVVQQHQDLREFEF